MTTVDLDLLKRIVESGILDEVVCQLGLAKRIAESGVINDQTARQLLLRVIEGHDHDAIEIALDEIEHSQHARDTASVEAEEKKQRFASADADLARARSEITRLAQPITGVAVGAVLEKVIIGGEL